VLRQSGLAIRVLLCLVVATGLDRPVGSARAAALPASGPAKAAAAAPAPARVAPKPPDIARPRTPAPPDTAGRLFMGGIPAPSLEGNLLGDPATQPIAVYLPPSYFRSTAHYPTVYFLPGFGDRVKDFVIGTYGFRLPGSVDSVIAAGAIREMIVVVVNGRNRLGGSFYADSPVTGKWESWVLDDVVNYVDIHYRTIHSRTSRGIAGHSMGRSAAFSIGMRHPEMFSAVYSMSPGVFDPDGLSNCQMFSSREAIDGYLSEDSTLAALPAGARLDRFWTDLPKMHWTRIFAYAYGAAFSPDPKAGAPFIRYPFRRADGLLVRDDDVWKTWEAGFGDIPGRIRTNWNNLDRLRAIAVEFGTRDENPWIPPGCRYLSQQLKLAHIDHQLIPLEVSHDEKLGERMLTGMLPFFSRALVFDR